MKIFITGSGGFLGRNVISYLNNEFEITKYNKDDKIDICENVILHLAGKSHDIKKTLNSHEYYEINTDYTKKIFNAFLTSNAKKFIFISSVKAVADRISEQLIEDIKPNPHTDYGKSKLMAEEYIMNAELPKGKSVYILRPCMIHGPYNKGNLNLLFKLIEKGFPWPLAAFDNKRSFCSVENISFIIKELIKRDDIESGIYNIADSETLSTNELISLIGNNINKKVHFLFLPKMFVKLIARIGDVLFLPLNTERLNKLTESYIVNNSKILNALGKKLPVNSKEGLITTINSFKNV